MNVSRGSRLPLFLAAITSVIWLGAFIWACSLQPADLPHDPLGMMIVAAGALTPVAMAFALAAAVLAARGARAAGAARDTGALSFAGSLEDAEARLSGAASRIDSVRSFLAADMETFESISAALVTQGEKADHVTHELARHAAAAEDAARRLGDVLPRAEELASRMDVTIDRSAEAMQRHHEQLDDARQKAESGTTALLDAGQTVTTTWNAAFAELEQRSIAARTAADAGIGRLQAEGDALATRVERAGSELEAMTGDARRRMEETLAAMHERSTEIEAGIARQHQLVEQLLTSAERNFQLVEARINHHEKTSQGALGRLSERATELNRSVDSLAEPLRTAQQLMEDYRMSVAALREATDAASSVLATDIPDRAAAARDMGAALSESILGLTGTMDMVERRARSLAAPIAESRGVLEEASRAYAEQREAIAMAAEALVVELNQARELIADVERQTESTSLAAATRLVDAMSQVRDVASQTSATVRNALEKVIADARDSLSGAAAEAMQASFSGPIAQQATAAEAAAAAAADTARGASERTAASMLALAETLQRIESRVGLRRSELEDAWQRDLLQQAQIIGDRLAGASISLSEAMGKPMTDSDWAEWRKGERTLFHRRAHALLTRRETRELRELLESDAAFADAAQRYTAEFDSLLKRLDPAGTGPLGTALLSSESGRTAAALTEALGR